MKTLLAILGSVTVAASPAIATISTNSNYSSKVLNSSQATDIWSKPTSIQALQESIRKEYESTHGTTNWSDGIESVVQDTYNRMLSGKTGTLAVLEMQANSETIDETFQDVYTNNTPNTQTFQTHSYSREITNTSEFEIKLNEGVSATLSASFIFGSASIKADMSSSQTWNDTETVTETVTAPSQPFIVDPYSKGIASYIVKSGTYNVKAAARIKFSPNTLITANMITGSAASVTYSLGQIVDLLNDAGYGDLIRMDSTEFSVISTDNPENPSAVYLNFPVNYVSKGGKLDVEFIQEPLN